MAAAIISDIIESVGQAGQAVQGTKDLIESIKEGFDHFNDPISSPLPDDSELAPLPPLPEISTIGAGAKRPLPGTPGGLEPPLKKPRPISDAIPEIGFEAEADRRPIPIDGGGSHPGPLPELPSAEDFFQPAEPISRPFLPGMIQAPLEPSRNPFQSIADAVAGLVPPDKKEIKDMINFLPTSPDPVELPDEVQDIISGIGTALIPGQSRPFDGECPTPGTKNKDGWIYGSKGYCLPYTPTEQAHYDACRKEKCKGCPIFRTVYTNRKPGAGKTACKCN
jgi:hypothetical protein